MSICRVDSRFMCDWACKADHCHLAGEITAVRRREADMCVAVQNQQLPSNPKQVYGDLKVPLALVPSTAIILMGEAFKEGARKYGAFNWRGKAVEAMTYAHANLRHLLAWIDGEDVDPESGKPHLALAMTSLAIIVDSAAVGCLIDNRPPKGMGGDLLRAKATAPTPAAVEQPVVEIGSVARRPDLPVGFGHAELAKHQQ